MSKANDVTPDINIGPGHDQYLSLESHETRASLVRVLTPTNILDLKFGSFLLLYYFVQMQ